MTRNRFSLDWMKSVSALLDEVSKQPAPRALVTVSRGKFYSNGLDLDWVLTHHDQKGAYVADETRFKLLDDGDGNDKTFTVVDRYRPVPGKMKYSKSALSAWLLETSKVADKLLEGHLNGESNPGRVQILHGALHGWVSLGLTSGAWVAPCATERHR